MLRSCLNVTLLLALALAPAYPGSAQLPVETWTLRPDDRAPAGIGDDALPDPGTYEATYRVQTMTYEGIMVGTDQVPEVLVLLDWTMVPLGMTVQRHEIEIRGAIRDWLGGSIRIPLQHTSVEFATNNFSGTPTTFGLGDIELRALYSIYDVWPFRAHLLGGISIPTGAVNFKGNFPDRPTVDVTLPYPMQPGDGTFALLPGAVFVTENEFGTVGFRADAKIPIGENGRNWTRGKTFNANMWMAYRFTDWVSGSMRLSYKKFGNIDGIDVLSNPFATPMSHPLLQGGSRLDVPFGVNIMFVEGPLEGNRLSAEFILPMHQDLDGPQISANYGAAFSWSILF